MFCVAFITVVHGNSLYTEALKPEKLLLIYVASRWVNSCHNIVSVSFLQEYKPSTISVSFLRNYKSNREMLQQFLHLH